VEGPYYRQRRPWPCARPRAGFSHPPILRQLRSSVDRLRARPFNVKGERAKRFELGSYNMKNFSKWFSGLAAIVLLAGPAVAADAVAAGKVKEVNAGKEEFVLTDSAGKDWTFKLGDTVIINRGGKESKSDLNAGDQVNVCYNKGLVHRTAHYILVQEGDTKDCLLVHGSIKKYDADKNQVTFTDTDRAKDWTFSMGHAKVRRNGGNSKIGDSKIGDRVLAIVERVGEGTILKCLMIERE
jgi:hypothetical protein